MRIETVANQLMFLLLEGFGGIERGANPYHHRTSIDRKPLRKTGREFTHVEIGIDHDRRHSGPAIGTGNFHTIGSCLGNAWAISNRFVYLRSRDVLALPAESIADPVDEVEESLLVKPHQIAGAKPGVALYKYVTQNFLFALRRVGVAFKTATPPSAVPIRPTASPVSPRGQAMHRPSALRTGVPS